MGRPLSPLARFAFVAATVAILVVAAAAWLVRFYAAAMNAPAVIGMDANLYVEQARSWLAGDGFYRPWQLVGQPYVVEGGSVTYPPTILLLLLPFTTGLPRILWWLVPLGTIAFSLVRMRPAVWSWPVLAVALIYPRTWVVVALGNPSMWVLAAIAAGLVWHWPAALAFLKPTFAPFALIGIWRRSWWIALAMIVLVSLPFGPMWLDYATAIENAGTSRGLEYLLGEWPIAAALIVAYAARANRTDLADTSEPSPIDRHGAIAAKATCQPPARADRRVEDVTQPRPND